MAEELYYNLNIVRTWKLNHNKDSGHVSSITDSQTMQAQTSTDTLWHETNSILLEEHRTASGVPDFVFISCNHLFQDKKM